MNKRTIEMVMHNPPVLPRTFEEDIKKELCNNYAFADKNGFYCTACKKYYKKQTGRLVDNEYNHKIELVAERKHRDVRMCPFCYKQVKKYDAWRGRKTLEQKGYIVILQSKAGGAFIRSFYICIDYDIPTSNEPRITYSEDKRVFLRNGESLILGRADCYEPYWGEYPDSRYCSFDNVNNSKHYFYQVDKIREPRMNRLPSLTIQDKPTHYFYFNDSALKKTSLVYSKLDKYRNFEPGVCDEDKLLVSFLYYSNKYPVLEKLLLEGFEMIVRQFVNFKNGYYYYNSSNFKGRIFNFRKSTVAEVFKCNKAELREIKEKIPNPLGRTQSAIIEELFFLRNKISVTDAYYLRSTDIIYHQEQLDLLHKYRSYHKIAKYFKQQNLETFRDYNDYLILLDRLNISKDNENTLFPSDFKVAHDSAVQRLQQKEDEERKATLEQKLKKFNKLLKKYKKKYTYSSKGLIIRPLVSIDEVYEEAQQQNNCVYTNYCEKYLKGKTILLVVRKKSEPDKAYCTVEVSLNDELIQCRAKNNASAPVEVKKFMDEFLDYIHNNKNLKKERKAS
jgi:hypothetical protein